jgi:hypothetical protein
MRLKKNWQEISKLVLLPYLNGTKEEFHQRLLKAA